MTIFRKQPNNWKPFHYLDFKRGDKIVPFNPLPPRYFPADTIWIQSWGVHCLLPAPWIYRVDPFTAFMAGGGFSSSIVGSLGGLALANLVMSDPKKVLFALGNREISGPASTTNAPIKAGFCIGDKYYENTYVYLLISRPVANILIPATYSDVFQRAKLKRYYVHHGAIVNVEEISEIENILTLDFDISFLSLDVNPWTEVKIYLTASGENKSYKISSISNEVGPFKIKVVKPQKEEEDKEEDKEEDPYKITKGDLYEFAAPACIEDPLMLTGFFNGLETDDRAYSENLSSGYNLFYTSENKFSLKTYVIGAYVLKNTETEEYVGVPHGASTFDSGNIEWVWVPLNKNKTSEIYGSDTKRYKEFIEQIEVTKIPPQENEATEEPIIIDAQQYLSGERTIGSEDDLVNWRNLENFYYYRLELNIGGNAWRANWHAPILGKGWAKQNNNYFKILAQPDGNVIDISAKDTTGKFELDLSAEISIFNQYGWKISEHYMGPSLSGFLGGRVDIVGEKDGEDPTSEIIYETSGESRGTIIENSRFNPEYLSANSFYERFMTNANISNSFSTKHIWEKTSGWFLTNREVSAKIKEIKVGPPSREFERRTVSITVEGVNLGFKNSDEVFVMFDENLYEFIGPMFGSLYTGQYAEGADGGGRSLPLICADIDFTTSFLKLNIDKDDLIGVVGGRWMGTEAQGAQYVFADNALPLFLSTQGEGIGTAAIYNNASQESWVFHSDYETKKVTVRSGQLNFQEFPKKIEVNFGFPVATESFSSFPINLNENYERIKNISMDMPYFEYPSENKFINDSDPSPIITFQIKDKNNYYGFFIDGKGDLELGPYSKTSFESEELDSFKLDFKYNDESISPCYLYRHCKYSPSKNKILHIGINTNEGPIYCKGGSPSNIKVNYIKNNQALTNVSGMNAHRLLDGENIIIYSKLLSEFEIYSESGPEFNNSRKNGNSWEYPYGIFVSGTGDNGLNWGCPLIKFMNYGENNNYQWPLMVMSNAKFLTSLYSPRSNYIMIFAKIVDNEKVGTYLGAIRIPISSILYQTELCKTKEGDDDNYFLWRPPAIPQDKTTWGPTKSLPTTLSNEEYAEEDKFVRIMGKSDFRTQIVTPGLDDWGIISVSQLDSGTIVLFYDDLYGVKALYSSTNGVSWGNSSIIFARDARAGFYLEQMLFYVSSFGLEMKRLNKSSLMSALIIAGGLGNYAELQEEVDNYPTVIIDYGDIPSQKISGYKDPFGITHIFYYNSEGKLSSATSEDNVVWKTTYNF